MQIIPAIDIKNGRCVRLTQGRPDTAVVYNEDPVKAAIHWQDEGAKYLHIVDLDGAFCGEIVNFEVVKKILSTIKIPAEVGGGIRTLDNIKKYIDIGVDRVVLGTQVVLSSEFLKRSIALYSNKIAVAIDTSNGKVVIEGWTTKTDTFAIDLARKVKDIGVNTIIYTDTTSDGTLKGPDFKNIKEFVDTVKTNIIVSGGISSIEDIERLRLIEGITGVIIGKALYTGKIKLTEAL